MKNVLSGLNERTKLEMEAGRKAVLLYDKLQKIEDSENLLKNAFPSLVIGATIKPPYTHVTLRARGVDDVTWSELDGDGKVYVSNLEKYGDKWQEELEFTEPIWEFPSDHLVAQLALIA